LLATCSAPEQQVASALNPAAVPAPSAPPFLHVDRAARRLRLLTADAEVLLEAPVGIGRGGLGSKRDMSDGITPSGHFEIDLLLYEDPSFNAIAESNRARFAADPELAALLADTQGLAQLFVQMNGLDFDGDGAADQAYGVAYLGLDGEGTGPKLRRFRGATPYWYSIALHGTRPENIGQARSGGCVHLEEEVLRRLIEGGRVEIGTEVRIEGD